MEIVNLGRSIKKMYEGPAGLTIYEINGENIELEFSNGIKLETPKVSFESDNVKKYVIFRDNKMPSDNKKFEKDKLYSVDYVYGDIDFDRLENDRDYYEKMEKFVFSREGLDEIVNKRCGFLPIDVQILKSTDEDGKEKTNIEYFYNKQMLGIVMDGVLRSAYREEMSKAKTGFQPNVEKGNDEEYKVEEVDLPSNPKKRLDLLEGTIDINGEKNNRKRKRSWAQTLSEIRKEHKEEVRKRREEKERRREREAGEDVPEFIDYAKEGNIDEISDNVLVVFNKTGIVVREKNDYDDVTGVNTGKKNLSIFSRYSMCFRDMSTHEISNMITVLLSGVDDKELAKKGTYRDKFVNDICILLLRSSKNMGTKLLPNGLNVKWPYLARFVPSEDCSIATDEKKEQKDFSKINRSKEVEDREYFLSLNKIERTQEIDRVE